MKYLAAILFVALAAQGGITLFGFIVKYILWKVKKWDCYRRNRKQKFTNFSDNY